MDSKTQNFATSSEHRESIRGMRDSSRDNCRTRGWREVTIDGTGDGQRPPADVLVMREEALREIELSVEIRWVWKR